MQVSKKLINKWAGLQDHGDVTELAKLTGKDRSTISKVIHGKQETTADVILKISDFYKSRKKVVKKITEEE